MKLPRIGFIGTGVMGAPMARNLLRAGYPMTVTDLDPAKTLELRNLGARWADGAGAVAREAQVLMTSLPGPKQVEQVAFAPGGVFANLEPGSIWLELSTNNLEVGHALVDAAREHQIALLDAPVSGGDEGAKAGTLTVLVGGDPAVFDRCRPIFEVIGERIEHLGPNGAGYAAKIAQVILCYVHSLALSEALMLGVKGGVDADKMLSIIQNTTGSSYVANRYGPPILSGDYDPSFTLGLALKDLKLAQALAQSVGTTLPLCDLTTATYAKACEAYGNEANHLEAVRLLEEANATYLRSPK